MTESKLTIRPLTERLHEAWRWYLTVDSADFVRQTLNRGLLIVIVMLVLLNIIVVVIAAGAQSLPIAISGLIFMAFAGLATALTRRGGISGAVLIALFIAANNAIIFLPSTYIDPPIIHVSFLIPTLIMTLFIRPLAVISGVLLQMGLLVCALLAAQIPVSQISAFFFFGLVDLLAIAAPLYMGAQVFHRAIGRLDKANQELDIRVAERTAELQRVMGLREQDIGAAVHDINNRLTVVRAEIDVLLLDATDAGLQPEVVATAEQRIGASLNAVSALVDDLRTAVLLDNQSLELRRGPLSLADLVERVSAQLATYASLTQCMLRLELAAGLPLISGDEHKLERALINLVGNALKYTRQMSVGQRDVLVVLAQSEGGQQISIIDSGPGLDAQALQLLGQPFARFSSSRGTEGMGLGVYISRGIIEHHGGWVRYASPGPNCGTTVSIWMPEQVAT